MPSGVTKQFKNSKEHFLKKEIYRVEWHFAKCTFLISVDFQKQVSYPHIKNQSTNICFCSVTQSCPALWDPMDYSIPGFHDSKEEK